MVLLQYIVVSKALLQIVPLNVLMTYKTRCSVPDISAYCYAYRLLPKQISLLCIHCLIQYKMLLRSVSRLYLCEDQRRYLTPVSVPFYRDISDLLCANMKLFSHTTAIDQLSWWFVKNWMEWSVVSIRLRGLELVAGCCEDGDEHVGSIKGGDFLTNQATIRVSASWSTFC
jgi:hypothetical protein